jgi:hypothetical protein
MPRGKRASAANASAYASPSTGARTPPGGLGTPMAASASYIGCSLKILTRRRYTNASMAAINGYGQASWRAVEIHKDAHGLTAEQIGDDLGRRTLDLVIVAAIAAARPGGQGVRPSKHS